MNHYVVKTVNDECTLQIIEKSRMVPIIQTVEETQTMNLKLRCKFADAIILSKITNV